MEKDILIVSKSDIASKMVVDALKSLEIGLEVRRVEDFHEVDDELISITIVDLSVYTRGILEKVEDYKRVNSESHLIGLTYSRDDSIDQLLIKKGIDQVVSMDDLSHFVEQNLALRLA